MHRLTTTAVLYVWPIQMVQVLLPPPEVLLLRAGGQGGMSRWMDDSCAPRADDETVYPQLGIAGVAGAYPLLCDLMENERRMDLEA